MTTGEALSIGYCVEERERARCLSAFFAVVSWSTLATPTEGQGFFFVGGNVVSTSSTNCVPVAL